MTLTLPQHFTSALYLSALLQHLLSTSSQRFTLLPYFSALPQHFMLYVRALPQIFTSVFMSALYLSTSISALYFSTLPQFFSSTLYLNSLPERFT